MIIEETVGRLVNDLIGRLDGPLHFRIIVQPLLATVLAVRDGLRDERNQKPFYFQSLFTDSALRPTLIRSGWRSIGRVFILAVVLDAIYQVIVVRWFYPFETLIVAIILALFPYALLRGVINRVTRAFDGSRATVRSSPVSPRHNGRTTRKS